MIEPYTFDLLQRGADVRAKLESLTLSQAKCRGTRNLWAPMGSAAEAEAQTVTARRDNDDDYKYPFLEPKVNF